MTEPDLSTLPKRMRYAAEVIEEVRNERSRQHNGRPEWPVSEFVPQDLRKIAEEWEEAAEREALVKELARVLRDATTRGDYDYFARHLIESGWRKGDPA